MSTRHLRRRAWILVAALAATATLPMTAWANAPSEASEVSAVSIAVSVAMPIAVIAGAGSLVVTGVEASANGAAWAVEGSVDGVKGSIRFAGRTVDTSVVGVGTVLAVTAIGSGVILSTAGRVVAFIPNEVGQALFHNEKVSP